MITIVAGLTRTGLSVTMQMLAAGGYDCAGTHPDFEPFPMGQIPWKRCDGKAVKLVDAQHQLPPPGSYRVIRLRRDMIQQARSFNKWTKAIFNGQPIDESRLAASFVRDYEPIDAWIATQPRSLILDFETICLTPRVAAIMLAEFMQRPLNIDKMAAVVRPRSSDCYPTILELELMADH